MENVKLVIVGIGAVGTKVVQLMMDRKQRGYPMEIVGAVDNDPAKIGKDVGEVAGVRPIGITVSSDFEGTLAHSGGNICLLSALKAVHNIRPFLVDMIVKVMRSKMNVVTLSGFAFSTIEYPDDAESLDREAKANGVSMVGTGLNPGFAMDLLPAFLTSVCGQVEKIEVERIADLTPFGPQIINHVGAGLSPSEFDAAVREGRIVLHLGFKQSMGMIAHALKVPLEKIEEWSAPEISKDTISACGIKVTPGLARGYRQGCKGYSRGKLFLDFAMTSVVGYNQEKDPYKLGTTIRIFGDPNISARVDGLIGVMPTAAITVNLMPHLLKCKPGLVSMTDLPCVNCF